MEDSNLDHTIILEDNHPQGINFRFRGEVKYKFVVNVSHFIFQRFYVIDDGTVICDEVSQGKRFIRSNRKFDLKNDIASFIYD